MATQGTLRYTLLSSLTNILGTGSFGVVMKATEKTSGQTVAMKKSRVSLQVKRPHLEHEAHVLQLLQGILIIPTLYGYGRFIHFEYISMELLGPSLYSKQKEGESFKVTTVARITCQVLSGLQHIHSLGIIHCDIKPANILCVLEDPSKIKLIDFGLARPSFPSQDAAKSLRSPRRLVGTRIFASLNSHEGKALGRSDDLESLAYTSIQLLQGHLPWDPAHSTEVVRLIKIACSGEVLASGFPEEFANLVTYSRALPSDQIPEYGQLLRSFSREVSGYSDEEPFDWMPCDCSENHVSPHIDEEYRSRLSEEDDESEDDSDDIQMSGSYFGYDFEWWEEIRQVERGGSLTLPLDESTPVRMDVRIPLIEEVDHVWDS